MLSELARPTPYLEILEIFSLPGGAVNDDRAGYAGNAVWVIDGATDISTEKLLPGGSDAAWIADAIAEALTITAPAFSGSIMALAETVTSIVAERFAAERIAPPPHRGRHPSAAGLIMRLQDGFTEVLSMGDCQLLLSLPGQPAKLCGVDFTRLGDKGSIARVLAYATQNGLDWMSAKAELNARNPHSRADMNLPGGYSAFSIDMPPRKMIHMETFETPPGTRFLLMSDGFARLYEVFGLYAEASLLEAAFDTGIAALADTLRKLEADDLHCVKFPRMKPRDDATALTGRII